MVFVFRVDLHWLSPEEGGRSRPVHADRYTPTARFTGEQEQFSVVMEFPKNAGINPETGTLRLLNLELASIQGRIRPHVALEIMEGERVVAECVVESAASGMKIGAGSS